MGSQATRQICTGLQTDVMSVIRRTQRDRDKEREEKFKNETEIVATNQEPTSFRCSNLCDLSSETLAGLRCLCPPCVRVSWLVEPEYVKCGRDIDRRKWGRILLRHSVRDWSGKQEYDRDVQDAPDSFVNSSFRSLCSSGDSERFCIEFCFQ